MRRPLDVGQTLVEFALVLPVLLLLMMGLFDFGRAIFAYNAVSEAARNGARIALVNQTSVDICTVVSERAVGLGLPPACALTATAPGVFHQSTCVLPQCNQLVRVNYQFTAITPIVSAIIGPIGLSSTSQVRVERACPPLRAGETACPKP